MHMKCHVISLAFLTGSAFIFSDSMVWRAKLFKSLSVQEYKATHLRSSEQHQWHAHIKIQAKKIGYTLGKRSGLGNRKFWAWSICRWVISMFFSFNRTYHNFWRSSQDFRRSSEAFQLRPRGSKIKRKTHSGKTKVLFLLIGKEHKIFIEKTYCFVS